MTLRSSHTAVVVSRFKILGTKTVTLKGYFESPAMYKCNFNNQLQIDSIISHISILNQILYIYIHTYIHTHTLSVASDCLCQYTQNERIKNGRRNNTVYETINVE